ncbi:helix-turn-helix domain-containing protein, partial [Pseudorhizobium marinum]|uniref:helix-turn-helix domain-containing protein n=1 Tax=Pseudorhizobium marinum TaxID=1496690 RepID=UPI000496FD82
MEARILQGGLQRVEWTFSGRRNRIFLLGSGSGLLRLRDREAPLLGPLLVWVPAGEAGSIGFDAGSEGGWLAIPDVFLGSAMPSGAVFSQVREAVTRPIVGARLPLGDAKRHLATVATIEQELRADLPGAEEAVRHHLALLLLAIWRLSEPAARHVQPSPRVIVRSFVHLVELHATEHWTIPRYAAALGITPDRLNTAVRRATGQTPTELIHARILSQAAMLLGGTTMQIGEIAEALGFKDAAYFSRFFKRQAGVSPKSHREDAAIARIPGETSYAAWP